MKKIFTLITALTLSVGLLGEDDTRIWHWEGSQAVSRDTPFTIDASAFDSAQAGNRIHVWFEEPDHDDVIEFKANGQKLPGTHFNRIYEWVHCADLFMTQDAVDSCKVYGMEICCNDLTFSFVTLSISMAAEMKEGKAIWTGSFWVNKGGSTIEVFKEALTAVKDWSKYSAMRFYYNDKYPTTDYSIYLLADESEDGVIAKSEPARDGIAGNPLKRYEGYAELDLTRCNPLTVINNVASDRLMIRMQGSAEVRLTDVVLVEQTAPVEGDQFVDATSGLKFEAVAVGEANTVKVMKNDYTGTSYTVPATVSYQSVTFNVTEIGKDAFEECSSLESVTIPASVTTIGQNAFHECESLQSVTLSEGLLTIGKQAFAGCESLQSVTIPASVTTIGAYAFFGCESLQSVTLSENLTTIEEAAFHECPSLASITIPAGVTAIGVSAFAECAGLTSVTFQGNACQNNIGEMAFNSVGSTTPATLVLPANWTGTKPDEDGNWYGGKFELSEDPTALPKVDKTGITVNGRKYGFPVRLVKEVK